MHSERALLASSFVIPLVLALHSAILLFFISAAGLAERQPFMNALRSSPFLSPACSLQAFILSCCDILPSLASAAYAPPQAKNPTSASAKSLFIARLLKVDWDGRERFSGQSTASVAQYATISNGHPQGPPKG